MFDSQTYTRKQRTLSEYLKNQTTQTPMKDRLSHKKFSIRWHPVDSEHQTTSRLRSIQLRLRILYQSHSQLNTQSTQNTGQDLVSDKTNSTQNSGQDLASEDFSMTQNTGQDSIPDRVSARLRLQDRTQFQTKFQHDSDCRTGLSFRRDPAWLRLQDRTSFQKRLTRLVIQDRTKQGNIRTIELRSITPHTKSFQSYSRQQLGTVVFSSDPQMSRTEIICA